MDKERRVRSPEIQARAMEVGQQRQTDTLRKCPVNGCKKRPKSYSRYCKTHADRLRSNGHPTLDVRVQSTEQYEQVLKIGRWVRHKLTGDKSDERAWLRVEAALRKIGQNQTFAYDIPTVVRREQHWRNAFKAAIVLHRRMATGVDPEEIIAAYLGMAAVVLKDNEVLVNRRQMKFFLDKTGARAIMRHMRFAEADEHAPDKVYRWRPRPGTVTAVGAIMNERISYQFGKLWWKRVDEAVASLKAGREAGPEAEREAGPEGT